MRKDEIVAHNRDFVAMATELLQVLRGTEDRSCSVCGAKVGKQHHAGQICRSLVEWRHSSTYTPPKAKVGGAADAA